MEVKGRNLLDGLPKNVSVSSEEIREALSDPVNQILDAIRATLEKTPPELAADIIDHGIMLTGGGALLRGLDKLISQETRMPVHIAEILWTVLLTVQVCALSQMLLTLFQKHIDKRAEFQLCLLLTFSE